MKPLKLLACLVTLQFTCGQPLPATVNHDYRQWTDTKGRTMFARIVEIPDPSSVKIERKDDGRIFTVPVATFSVADQDYVKTHQTETGLPLKDADSSLWTLLNAAGHQPASTYTNTQLDLIIEGINQRFVVRDVKAASGLPLSLRTEPTDLASRIRINGDMPRLDLDTFVREIVRSNNLGIMTDPDGMVVLVERQRSKPADAIKFLGVSVEAR